MPTIWKQRLVSFKKKEVKFKLQFHTGATVSHDFFYYGDKLKWRASSINPNVLRTKRWCDEIKKEEKTHHMYAHIAHGQISNNERTHRRIEIENEKKNVRLVSSSSEWVYGGHFACVVYMWLSECKPCVSPPSVGMLRVVYYLSNRGMNNDEPSQIDGIVTHQNLKRTLTTPSHIRTPIDTLAGERSARTQTHTHARGTAIWPLCAAYDWYHKSE